jgi:ribonuclease HII
MAKTRLFLGIDDAGRGPVIGPLVIAGCLIEEEVADLLRKKGVKDSKQVLPEKREILAKAIREVATDFYIVQSSATEIDSTLRSGINLNQLEALKSAEIINHLLLDRKEEVTVQLDCPSNNVISWRNYLLDRVDEKIRKRIRVMCEHRADINYVAASAASILAKVTRDYEVEQIKKKYCIDIGSGYPADPVCKEFLKKHGMEFQKHGIIRETWQTWKDHVNNSDEKKRKSQKNLTEF